MSKDGKSKLIPQASRDKLSGPGKRRGVVSSESGGGLSESTVRTAAAALGALAGASVEVSIIALQITFSVIGAITVGSIYEVYNFGVRALTNPKKGTPREKQEKEEKLRNAQFGNGFGLILGIVFKLNTE